MRWLTLVLPVTLFYSLSIVYAIPHDDDEKHHWLHKRQGLPSSSPPLSDPVVSPSPSPQDGSSPPVSPTPSLGTSEPSSLPPSSSPPIPTQPSATPEPSPEPSSTVPSSTSSTPSTSSSSSRSSSSTRSTTSSPSPTTTNRPETQSRTSSRRPSSTPKVPSDTESANGNTRTGTGSGNSFLKNKAAMGSTFAIVGLVGVAIIIGTVFFLIKKARKRRDRDELDTYFEKLPSNNGNSASNRNAGGDDYGLPSPADLTSPAHDQAYMSRDVHYGTDQYPNPFANYNGFEYPPERGSVIERPASVSYVPGTAYAAAMSQRGQYNYQGQLEDPNTVPNHPFADPDARRY